MWCSLCGASTPDQTPDQTQECEVCRQWWIDNPHAAYAKFEAEQIASGRCAAFGMSDDAADNSVTSDEQGASCVTGRHPVRLKGRITIRGRGPLAIDQE